MPNTNVMQVGPLGVQASCAFQSKVDPNMTRLIVPCGVRVQNTHQQTLYLTAQSISLNSTTNLPGLHETSTVTFYPGQIMSLPKPPSGQVWQIAVMTRRDVRHMLNRVGDIALVVLGLAAYGGYELVRNRRAITQRVRNIF